MKTYRITIRATIEKDIVVEAETESEATQKAYAKFNLEQEDGEDYTERVVGAFVYPDGTKPGIA